MYMYVCMYVFMNAFSVLPIPYICMYVYVHVCVLLPAYFLRFLHVGVPTKGENGLFHMHSMHVCVCMYVCLFACM